MIQTHFVYICDLCRTEKKSDKAATPPGWVRIVNNYTDPAGHDQSSDHDLCRECCAKIIKAKESAK